MTDQQKTQTNLDPQDWSALRALGHRMVDDALSHLEHLRENPIWKTIPQEIKGYFDQPVPLTPGGEDQTYQEFKDSILAYQMGNTHPRFWGWVMGNGIPYAALADMLASMINPNMGAGEHIGVYVEHQVINWLKELMGFPAQASGILTSGGSMSNFIGLAVARNTKAGFDIRSEGVGGAPRPMTFYASSETHSSNYKAIEQLGIGKKWLRFIPVDECYRMDIDVLENAIQNDQTAGYQPVCIIGNAATTNTGAFDDLNAIAEICEREDMWFHVDGAFGALVALSDTYRHLVAGMERADSLAFDLHKWMYMPFEVACVLIRDFDDHINTFAASPDYLSHMPRGVAGGDRAWFGDMGMQLTRSFRALKVWMTFKAYGLEHFTRQIEQDIENAHYLEDLVRKHPNLELLADVPLNIVCFRYRTDALEAKELNEFNTEIMLRLHERGLAIPSYTRLNGNFALRVSITNHRSTRADFDFLVNKVTEIADEILTEKSAAKII